MPGGGRPLARQRLGHGDGAAHLPVVGLRRLPRRRPLPRPGRSHLATEDHQRRRRRMTRPRPINFAPSPRMQRAIADARPVRSGEWFRVENSAGAADVYIYDDIGWWGVTTMDFVDAIKSVGSMPINLHINSGGGDAWDGVTIYNAIRNHPAPVTVHVDGIAASAASVIAMAGDRVLMAK